jgi:hypothetical protein
MGFMKEMIFYIKTEGFIRLGIFMEEVIRKTNFMKTFFSKKYLFDLKVWII